MLCGIGWLLGRPAGVRVWLLRQVAPMGPDEARPPNVPDVGYAPTYKRAWYSFRVPSTRSQRFSAGAIDPSRSIAE